MKKKDKQYWLDVETDNHPFYRHAKTYCLKCGDWKEVDVVRSALDEGYSYAFECHGETAYMNFNDRVLYRIKGPQHVSFGVFGEET